MHLLANVLRALVARSDLDPALVDDIIAGCVTQAGDQAVNVGRNALLAAGFPVSKPATTIDRQCGSSQQAMHFAAQGVIAGAYDVVIACGVESMSRVPMFSSVHDGHPQAPLRARFPSLPNQGIGAELIAARWGFDREALDAFAADSHLRAAKAAADGAFVDEIVPVTLADGSLHEVDETVRGSTTVEGLAGLKPSFFSDEMAGRYTEIGWSITPGNSSPLSDGASAALIMSEERGSALGLTPRARFHAFAVLGSDPEVMLTGPIPATREALDRSGLTMEDLDLYEVNEAFASVPLAWAKDLGADPEKLNPRGGGDRARPPARSVRHAAHGDDAQPPRGNRRRYGLQTMCEGGGMANVTVVARLG